MSPTLKTRLENWTFLTLISLQYGDSLVLADYTFVHAHPVEGHSSDWFAIGMCRTEPQLLCRLLLQLNCRYYLPLHRRYIDRDVAGWI
jgi:hypothetical protein